jgi:hypothetical protein
MSRRRSDPKPISPNSSYKKVLYALEELPISREVMTNLNEMVDTAIISKAQFSVNTWNATVSHTFKMKMDLLGNNKVEKVVTENMAGEALKIALKEGIEEKCISIVRGNFGQKHCPTYNCSAKKVDLAEHLFNKWYANGLQSNFVAKAEFLEEDMARIKTTEEYLRSERLALSKQAIEEIKISLRKYKEVSEEVVQQAVDEYLCERVVDS